MNTTTNEVTTDDAPRGPFWKVVGGSLATGTVLALGLMFVVFAGAQEHIVAASALIGFAAGWAMLAMLSSRYTNRPQRWAYVPAAFMAFVAIVLLVFSPGDDALTTAGWVWPPVVIALAVWMTVQVRRTLAGRVRWLLYPIIAMLIASSIGGLYQTIVISTDADSYAAPGEMYDVGGYQLHINCVGSGAPTVVLENGLSETSPFWSRITPQVSSTTRVCAYDRAGQGWSDDPKSQQDGIDVATDLHTLLHAAGEEGPYVIVGHSTGGAYAMIFAAQYPDEVAGMVLLDSATPYQFSALPDYDSQYWMMTSMLGVMPSLARIGATQLLPAAMYSSLPEPAASQVRAFATSPREMRSVRNELSVYRDVFRQAQALTTLGDKPLVVVETTESKHDIKGWSAAQAELAMLSSNSQHRVADATHEGLLDNASMFQPSVAAIIDVVTAIRSGERVVNS